MGYSWLALMTMVILLTQAGCGSFTSPFGSRVECERAINYQGYEAELSGIEIPIALAGGQTTFKLGKATFKPTKVREAREIVGVLDLLQFSDCQTMILIKDDAVRVKIADRRRETMVVLVNALKRFDSSQSDEDLDAAINTTRQEVEKVKAKPGA